MNDFGQAGAAQETPVIPAASVFEGAVGSPTQQFVPFLDLAGRLGGEGALHMLRRRARSGEVFFESVWTFVRHGVDDGEDARRVFAWMWSRPDLWSSWGRSAVGLGGDFLTRVIERDAPPRLEGTDHPVDGAEGEDGPDADPDPLADDAEGPERGRLWCACRDDGYGRDKSYWLTMYYEEEERTPFFRLNFAKASERDRVWDWMQHQTARYQEFASFHALNGKEALKKLMFGGMLETERAVKKAGLGSGGMRPLRFWPGPAEVAADA